MKKLILNLGILTCSFISAQEITTDTLKVKKIEALKMSKKTFTKTADRLVYDVANTPLAKGNTAFNLLKETPLVSSTDDQTLRIAGKSNAHIYINGRKTQMNADAIVAFLKNTPAENIQKIEVISMPGSEFQVESSDGIINIILKKRTDNGWNGNLRMANNQGYYNNPSAGVSVDYRKNRLGFSANFNTNDYTEQQYYKFSNGDLLNSNNSEGSITYPRKDYGGYLNVDYALNDKSNLALSYNTLYNKGFGSTSDLFNTIKTLKNNVWETRYNRTQNFGNKQSYHNAVNLNYELKTDSMGSTLNLNTAYLNYTKSEYNSNSTSLADAYGHTGDLMNRIIQHTPQVIHNLSASADYIQQFKNHFKLYFGGTYNYTRTENNTVSTTYHFHPDIRLEEPNYFTYTENIYSLYLNFEKKFSDKFYAKIGSRYELTRSEGNAYHTAIESFKNINRNAQNLLPYLSLNYAIDKDHNISYTLSSRVRRPSFWELNPARTYLTEFNYIQNNPFVKIASIYSHELNYMYKNSYFLIMGYKYFKDPITQVPLQGPAYTNGQRVNIIRYIRTNFGSLQEFNFNFNVRKIFFKQYWTSNFSIGLQRNINKGSLDIDPVTEEKFPMYMNTSKSNSLTIGSNNNIRLDLAKTWYAGVNFWFVDKQQIHLGELKALGSLDLSLKKIWSHWTFMARVYDILNTNKAVINSKQEGSQYNTIQYMSYNQQLDLSVTYNFGNKKVKKIRTLNTAADVIKTRTQAP
ncbi:TonB-dependent receptor [Elizabethkingia argentiflava]|uniref:TonB-dependent receptor n=1 Tax=Elizabethkingia argenteiflava TaxID=2681556 RepID=A0A845Q197_9FLAO|nr:outer membrane beta-barrel family protein [Elizabethkingia argenteiflava]NAW52100.1 TonB-dependent receptor [Elizabethkingia argenteiflava]